MHAVTRVRIHTSPPSRPFLAAESLKAPLASATSAGGEGDASYSIEGYDAAVAAPFLIAEKTDCKTGFDATSAQWNEVGGDALECQTYIAGSTLDCNDKYFARQAVAGRDSQDCGCLSEGIDCTNPDNQGTDDTKTLYMFASRNGWDFSSQADAPAWVALQLSQKAIVNGVGIVSGTGATEVGSAGTIKAFSIELSVNATLGYKAVKGLAFLNKVDGGMIQGNGVTCGGQTEVKLSFDAVEEASAG